MFLLYFSNLQKSSICSFYPLTFFCSWLFGLEKDCNQILIPFFWSTRLSQNQGSLFLHVRTRPFVYSHDCTSVPTFQNNVKRNKLQTRLSVGQVDHWRLLSYIFWAKNAAGFIYPFCLFFMNVNLRKDRGLY